jgi:hypothetical protein
VSQSSSSPRSTGSDHGISCNSTVIMQCFKTSTRLLYSRNLPPGK